MGVIMKLFGGRNSEGSLLRIFMFLWCTLVFLCVLCSVVSIGLWLLGLSDLLGKEICLVCECIVLVFWVSRMLGWFLLFVLNSMSMVDGWLLDFGGRNCDSCLGCMVLGIVESCLS